jgi:hypothetical protein
VSSWLLLVAVGSCVGECGCEEWCWCSISMDACVAGGIVRFKGKGLE